MNEQEQRLLVTLEARIDALEQTLGTLTMLAMRELPADQRLRFAEGLAQMARTAEKAEAQPSAVLLTELHRAAVLASGRS